MHSGRKTNRKINQPRLGLLKKVKNSDDLMASNFVVEPKGPCQNVGSDSGFRGTVTG